MFRTIFRQIFIVILLSHWSSRNKELLKVIMIKSLSWCDSWLWTWIKHSCQKLKLWRTHFLLHFICKIHHTFVVFLNNLRIWSSKQILSKNQFVKYRSYTKHVADCVKSTRVELLIFYFQNLWSHISSGTTSDKKIFWLIG